MPMSQVEATHRVSFPDRRGEEGTLGGSRLQKKGETWEVGIGEGKFRGKD